MRLALGVLDHCLADGVDITGADGQDEVAGFGQFLQAALHVVQRGAVFRAGNALGQILGGDAQRVLLPGSVDLRQQGDVGTAQLPDEVAEQRLGAGVGVGLEGADDALIAQRPDGVQQGTWSSPGWWA